MSNHQFWFRSTLFKVEPGEDEETNPLCFGRQLARWLREHLIEQGRSVEEIIPEDWGWCLVTQRKPFLLWVGCVSVHHYADAEPRDSLHRAEDFVWICTVVAVQTLLSKLFGAATTDSALEALFQQVRGIVESETANTFVLQP